MPRGGRRLGAGRKPKTRRERWLGGNAGKRPLTLVTPERTMPVESVLTAGGVSVPAVLTAGERAYWDLWSPLAISQGLLTAETVPGFVTLCKTARTADVFWSAVEDRGLEQEKVTIDGAGQEHREYKANPLLSHWRALMARMEQLQARYGLAADGKVLVGGMSEDAEEAALAQLMAVR